MCCFSGRVSSPWQNLFFTMRCSFNSLCVKFVVHEEHNVFFQPTEKDPPQKPMTALNKPAKRPSLLPLTYQTPLKQLLSRAAVAYPVILLPVNLSGSRQPRAGSWPRLTHRTPSNAAEARLLHTRSSERGQLRAPHQRQAQLVYCGLISNNASPGQVSDGTCRGGQRGRAAPRAASIAAQGQAATPPSAPARHRVHSQDLQVTQGAEGSIFDAADLVVVQLPAERKGEDEGWLGAPGWGFPVSEVSLHPLAAPAQLPRCSGLLAAV